MQGVYAVNPAFVNPLNADRSLHDKIIVSCGTEPHYYEALHSTRLHCAKYVPEAWQLFYYGYPDGCPTQAERQYAFKIYALERAFAAGFSTMLWLDSAFQPIGSLAPLWKEIEEQGWYIQQQGSAVLGNWCSDAALGIFGIGRDEAMRIPLCYSGLVGLNLRNTTGNNIWTAWQALYNAGAFDGPHRNYRGPRAPWGYKLEGDCSPDPRCEGHRHDESALSFILYRMGLKPRTEPFLTIDSPKGFIGHHVRLECR